EGLLARRRKELRPVGELPAVTVLDIPSDADPDDLYAFPAKWDDEEGEKPRVAVTVGKDARVVPAPGDRILARIQRSDGLVPDRKACSPGVARNCGRWASCLPSQCSTFRPMPIRTIFTPFPPNGTMRRAKSPGSR